MPRKFAYPWFFFYRIAQLALLAILPPLAFLLFLDKTVFLKIFPLAAASYVVFLYLFHRSIRPLGSILAKVQKIQDEIPFDTTLSLLYRQDEWAHVEEALNRADKRLLEQIAQAKTENEKSAAILESIHDDIIAVDNFETVLFFNSNFKRHFIQDKSKGELMPKLWHTFSEVKILSTFRGVLKSGEEATLKDMGQLSLHQPDRIFDLKVTPLRNDQGKVIGALGVFYDVTEFKRTEQMRVDFVANVSHEIRTPLTSIRGFTQVLDSQKDQIAPELHGFLGKIVSNTERMITLFNDLLNLSVIESRDLLKAEPFPLAPVLESIEENITTNYPGHDVVFEEDLTLPEIRGDERLIQQVLTNLIDNACKYADRPDIRIKVSSSIHLGKALLAVSDNGPGIPKEHLQRIFERFYRVDSSRESSRGTGLGLSIVKHIVAKHGGRIWAESERTGTTFFIELPL